MTKRTYVLASIIAAAILLALSAQGTILMPPRGKAVRPPASEFGPGPRASAKGLYIASLQGADALKARRMYTIQTTVVDGKTGKAITEATILVDGGMPQHGHGLPTRPRVTNNLGDGKYEISGLRFNMGGWWELELTITTAAGTDTVTFHLSL